MLFGLQACAHKAPALRDQVSAKVEVRTIFGTASGSAVPITDQIYLTCAHVVQGMDALSVFVDDAQCAGIIYLKDIDAALLVMMEPHGKKPWRLDNRAVEPCEDVAVSGWGLGRHTWSKGLGTQEARRLSITIIFGDSGCPVLDADGDVVGIICAIDRRAVHHAFFVPMTEILPLLPESVRAYVTVQ
jgi:hypothetical protein